jgi:CheY-like chemotaxis protein
MTVGEKIRIVLADDHAVLRAGLRALLNAEPDMEVVGEAANGREAVERAVARAGWTRPSRSRRRAWRRACSC